MKVIYGRHEAADWLKNKTGRSFSSRDFTRQRWIFWKLCGSLLTYLCDAVRNIKKKRKKNCGLGFEDHWKHPTSVSNQSWCGNVLSCSRLFGMTEPCTHIHKTHAEIDGALAGEWKPGLVCNCIPDVLVKYDICVSLIHALKTFRIAHLPAHSRTVWDDGSVGLLALDSRLAFHDVVRIAATTEPRFARLPPPLLSTEISRDLNDRLKSLLFLSSVFAVAKLAQRWGWRGPKLCLCDGQTSGVCLRNR